LTTSAARKTEVGIRKVAGAQRQQLVWQFSIESIVLSVISMIIGIGLLFYFCLRSINLRIRQSPFHFQILLLFYWRVLGSLFSSNVCRKLPGFVFIRVSSGTRAEGNFYFKSSGGIYETISSDSIALSAFLIMSSVIMYRQMKFVTPRI